MWWSSFYRIVPNSRVIFQSRQSNIEAAKLFSSSTPIFAIEVHKSSQWKIKRKLTPEFTSGHTGYETKIKSKRTEFKTSAVPNIIYNILAQTKNCKLLKFKRMIDFFVYFSLS